MRMQKSLTSHPKTHPYVSIHITWWHPICRPSIRAYRKRSYLLIPHRLFELHTNNFQVQNSGKWKQDADGKLSLGCVRSEANLRGCIHSLTHKAANKQTMYGRGKNAWTICCAQGMMGTRCTSHKHGMNILLIDQGPENKEVSQEKST